MWGYVVIDCMDCDMIISMISLCMRLCMIQYNMKCVWLRLELSLIVVFNYFIIM